MKDNLLLSNKSINHVTNVDMNRPIIPNQKPITSDGIEMMIAEICVSTPSNLKEVSTYEA